ncbi:hypothetical protein VNO77_05286 [Canavalia gladiata]|uniref:Uncharacterized protein n=1 Tax=Canavalia gladiata TaxID=3824 RepID=A0AAN9R5I6_CANGL
MICFCCALDDGHSKATWFSKVYFSGKGLTPFVGAWKLVCWELLVAACYTLVVLVHILCCCVLWFSLLIKYAFDATLEVEKLPSAANNAIIMACGHFQSGSAYLLNACGNIHDSKLGSSVMILILSFYRILGISRSLSRRLPGT